MMADKAYITPKVLKWARESAKIPVDIAAGKLSVSADKITEWENGNSQPTLRQAELLAKAYRRPFALLFLPEIPKDFQPLQDFRRNNAQYLSTASTFIIREIQQKQSWISEVLADSNSPLLTFVGKYSPDSDPADVADDILATLQINPSKYINDNPIKEWLEKAELNGIFISRTSFIHSKLKLNKEELQGFAIADKLAPFIFINTDDWASSQLFTLVHELAHIWIAESGISNEAEPYDYLETQNNPIETFCNEVAANALLPKSLLLNVDKNLFNSSANLFRFSKGLGISSYALIVRAKRLGIISDTTYRKLKKEVDSDFNLFLKKEEEKKEKQKKQQGGPDYYLLQLNKNSRLFTQIVLDAYRGGNIEPTQASSLLNTQINNFSKFETYLYK